mmetsp:Transcript_63589/g.143445  ORF Transcript_63589/g.143445 Transcript_63589/m.143445 type:complete len:213 (+) Transcript_63589:747-1385(+)
MKPTPETAPGLSSATPVRCRKKKFAALASPWITVCFGSAPVPEPWSAVSIAAACRCKAFPKASQPPPLSSGEARPWCLSTARMRFQLGSKFSNWACGCFARSQYPAAGQSSRARFATKSLVGREVPPSYALPSAGGISVPSSQKKRMPLRERLKRGLNLRLLEHRALRPASLRAHVSQEKGEARVDRRVEPHLGLHVVRQRNLDMNWQRCSR